MSETAPLLVVMADKWQPVCMVQHGIATLLNYIGGKIS